MQKKIIEGVALFLFPLIIGLLGFYALIDKDYNIMMGFLVIGVIIRLVGNLISDLTYALIDPRIRFK